MPLLKRQAQARPDHLAIHLVGMDAADPGQRFTLAELDRRADQVARWFIGLGLQTGDVVALLLENHARCFELWWGARRAGLYYTPISVHAQADEVAYLVADCGARLLVTSLAQAEVASKASVQSAAPGLQVFMIDGVVAGFAPYEPAVAAWADDNSPLPERPIGREFLYSSGTTGRPKGIRRPMQPFATRHDIPALEQRLRAIFRFDEHTVYLAASPLYHATARFIVRTLECGGRAIVMPRFDAERALALIELHCATHSQWVPTMMVRMLALPDAVRARYDLHSMRCAIHAAAPCPPHVKDAMIAWWGPVIEEYYGGSENAGITHITSAQWQAHRGSVGRPIWGAVHILGSDMNEVPTGEVGGIYFSGSGDFSYHGDPEKTARAFSPQGYSTYGDLGHVDAEGYLYLSDRRADLIISGGVNLYPAEIEHTLATHPAVADVAVVGVADAEFGETVKAVVQLHPDWPADADTQRALLDHCLAHLSKFKCPRSWDFVEALPRSEAGKLLRRVVKDRYRSPA